MKRYDLGRSLHKGDRRSKVIKDNKVSIGSLLYDRDSLESQPGSWPMRHVLTLLCFSECCCTDPKEHDFSQLWIWQGESTLISQEGCRVSVTHTLDQFSPPCFISHKASTSLFSFSFSSTNMQHHRYSTRHFRSHTLPSNGSAIEVISGEPADPRDPGYHTMEGYFREQSGARNMYRSSANPRQSMSNYYSNDEGDDDDDGDDMDYTKNSYTLRVVNPDVKGPSSSSSSENGEEMPQRVSEKTQQQFLSPPFRQSDSHDSASASDTTSPSKSNTLNDDVLAPKTVVENSEEKHTWSPPHMAGVQQQGRVSAPPETDDLPVLSNKNKNNRSSSSSSKNNNNDDHNNNNKNNSNSSSSSNSSDSKNNSNNSIKDDPEQDNEGDNIRRAPCQSSGLPPAESSRLRTESPTIGSLCGNRSVSSTASGSVMSATIAHAMQSKYSKASYSLTNDPDALRKYIAAAEKTGDPKVQVAFAKYLLDIASLYKNPEDEGMSLYFSQSLVCVVKYVSSLDKKTALTMEGIRCIKRLAKEGVAEAAYLQATWMETQKYGFIRNSEKINRLHSIAASSGEFPASKYALAQHMERNNTGDPISLLQYYNDAAASGHAPSLFRLAQAYIHGHLGCRQNLRKGLALLHQAAERAAEATYPEPLFVLGQALLNIYPLADIPLELVQQYGGREAARDMFEAAANMGHVKAQVQIADIYEHGLYGSEMNLSTSFHYYNLAAQAGDPHAMLGLCRLYNGGIHGPGGSDEQERRRRDVSHWFDENRLDEDASFQWCQRAADLNLADAIFMLGWFYEKGFGTIRDFDRSLRMYQKAARLGNAKASERIQRHDRAFGGTQPHLAPAAVPPVEAIGGAGPRRRKRGKQRRFPRRCIIL
ncbi:hypothetical protein BX666DRAFT_194405 [Dichotomocladium elegans]|nr:hypothetical protein BX666DRAFT_194405 [Dichotomocladium elegans]